MIVLVTADCKDCGHHPSSRPTIPLPRNESRDYKNGKSLSNVTDQVLVNCLHLGSAVLEAQCVPTLGLYETVLIHVITSTHLLFFNRVLCRLG